jgi:hypothetical protein
MRPAPMPDGLRQWHPKTLPGVLSIEYEYHWENSWPEAGQRIGFVRRYGRVKKW